MAKTYEPIHYSLKQQYRGTGYTHSLRSGVTQYLAGADSSYRYSVYCQFSGLKNINASAVSSITLYLQRLVGGSDITYTVDLYQSVLTSQIKDDRLQTGLEQFTINRTEFSWAGSSSDVGGEYRSITIPTSLFAALRDYGWAITYRNQQRRISIGDVYVVVKTTETDYKLSYNANGGSGAPATQTGTGVGSYQFTISGTKPTRTGYTFLGWSTSASATTAAYSAGGRITVSADTTLYAVWQANTYTVTYKANGGTGADVVQSVTYGEAWASNAGASFSRPGYKLLGWANTADATAPVIGLGLTQPVWERTSNRTLYAVWLVQSIVHVKGADGQMHDGIVYVKGADGQMHVGIVYVKGADGQMHING